MSPSGRVLALALLVAFVAASAAPCPPRADRPQDGLAARAAAAPHAAPADPAPAASRRTDDPSASTAWCGRAPEAFLTAACPCGCADRAQVAGGGLALGWALPASAIALATSSCVGAPPGRGLHAPAAPRALPDPVPISV